MFIIIKIIATIVVFDVSIRVVNIIISSMNVILVAFDVFLFSPSESSLNLLVGSQGVPSLSEQPS